MNLALSWGTQTQSYPLYRNEHYKRDRVAFESPTKPKVRDVTFSFIYSPKLTNIHHQSSIPVCSHSMFDPETSIALESVTAHTFYFRFLLSMIRPSGATSHPCCHWSTIYDSLYASLVDINEEKIIMEKISSLFCFMRNCFHIVFWQQISQEVPFGK